MLTNQSNPLLPVPTGSFRIPEFPSPISGDDLAPELQPSHPVHFSLIIPTFNEGQNIKHIVELLAKLLDEVMLGEYELIVVDDNSPDRTWELALELVEQYPQLRVMRREHERGLSTAVIRGWQAAQGQVLGVIDADLQHPPEVLHKLLAAVEQGADLAVASRHVEGGGVSEWSAVRRFLSRGAQLLGLVILPGVIGRVTDPMSGYFMVRRSAIAGHWMDPRGYKILIEVLGRGEIDELAEVGYVFQERREGESKVTWKQYIDYIHHLLKLRSRGRVGRLKQKLRLPIKRFIQFGLVGLSGVFVDMAVFYLLSDPSTLGLGVTRSKIVAGELAIFNNFLWNDLWTFRDISKGQKGIKKLVKRFLKFNTVCLMGLILNVLILNLLLNVFGINRYVANLIAIAAVTLWNFWINLKLSWRTTEMK